MFKYESPEHSKLQVFTWFECYFELLWGLRPIQGHPLAPPLLRVLERLRLKHDHTPREPSSPRTSVPRLWTLGSPGGPGNAPRARDGRLRGHGGWSSIRSPPASVNRRRPPWGLLLQAGCLVTSGVPGASRPSGQVAEIHASRGGLEAEGCRGASLRGPPGQEGLKFSPEAPGTWLKTVQLEGRGSAVAAQEMRLSL